MAGAEGETAPETLRQKDRVKKNSGKRRDAQRSSTEGRNSDLAD